ETVDKIPGVGDVFGTAADQLFEKAGLPDSITLYAVSYCSTTPNNMGSESVQCALRSSSSFDVAVVLRVVLAFLYAVGVVACTVSLTCSMIALDKKNWTHHRYPSLPWTCMALLPVLFASTMVTVVACSIHMAMAEGLPRAFFSTEIGAKFLAVSWSALLCTALPLTLIGVEKRRCDKKGRHAASHPLVPTLHSA
ncbi:hypothetical protein BS50DRAFT_580664, partial [Corynespora cassiicola Philippines]